MMDEGMYEGVCTVYEGVCMRYKRGFIYEGMYVLRMRYERGRLRYMRG